MDLLSSPTAFNIPASSHSLPIPLHLPRSHLQPPSSCISDPGQWNHCFSQTSTVPSQQAHFPT
jgi:hypothetical protein